MKKIVAKYRREDGDLICAASCIELDDCVLQEGVPEEGTVPATPPLFVPRQDMTSTIGQTDAEDDEGLGKVAETEGTRKMYEESRDAVRAAAASVALNDYKSANLNMDPDTLRDIPDAVLNLQMKKHSRVTTNSFKQAFHAYCENGGERVCRGEGLSEECVNLREVKPPSTTTTTTTHNNPKRSFTQGRRRMLAEPGRVFSQPENVIEARACQPRGALPDLPGNRGRRWGKTSRRPGEGVSSDEHRFLATAQTPRLALV